MKTTALRHRVGSLLIVGVESTSLSALELAWMRSLQPSGAILFRRNIETAAQIHAMWQQAAAALTTPFFRCVDLEGGTVDRLRDLVGPTPSAAEVAATHHARDHSGERCSWLDECCMRSDSIWIWLPCWILPCPFHAR